MNKRTVIFLSVFYSFFPLQAQTLIDSLFQRLRTFDYGGSSTLLQNFEQAYLVLVLMQPGSASYRNA